MTEYFINRIDETTYQIAKFTGNSVPSAIYLVKGKKCDCPGGARRGTCKHIKMTQEWKPDYYYLNDMLVKLDSFDHENVITTSPSQSK